MLLNGTAVAKLLGAIRAAPEVGLTPEACALLLLRRRLRCIYVFCLNLHTHTHIIYTYATNYFCFIHSDLYEEIAAATRPPHPFSINFPSRLLFPH